MESYRHAEMCAGYMIKQEVGLGSCDQGLTITIMQIDGLTGSSQDAFARVCKVSKRRKSRLGNR